MQFNFNIPTADLYVAWTVWLLGYPSNKSKRSNGEVYSAPVRPLRLLSGGHLPTQTKKKFDNAWRPVLELMHDEVSTSIATTSTDKMDNNFIRSTYEHAFKNVCLKYPDIASDLGGGRAILTCNKALRRLKTNKRKAGELC